MGTPIFYEGVFIYMRTYYETLGVSADAKTDEIRKNYRRLVKENHPDLIPAIRRPRNGLRKSERHTGF